MTHESPAPARNQVITARSDTRLRGAWLPAARVVWVAVVGLALVVFVVALLVNFQAQRTILAPETQVPGQLTVEDVRLNEQWGLSLDFHAARPRDETDLERLTGAMLNVVDETMQPQHMALWLPPPGWKSNPRQDKDDTLF